MITDFGDFYTHLLNFIIHNYYVLVSFFTVIKFFGEFIIDLLVHLFTTYNPLVNILTILLFLILFTQQWIQTLLQHQSSMYYPLIEPFNSVQQSSHLLSITEFFPYYWNFQNQLSIHSVKQDILHFAQYFQVFVRICSVFPQYSDNFLRENRKISY